MFIRTLAILVAVCFFMQVALCGVRRRDAGDGDSQDPLQQLQEALSRIADAARAHFNNATAENSQISNALSELTSHINSFGQQLAHNVSSFVNPTPAPAR